MVLQGGKVIEANGGARGETVAVLIKEFAGRDLYSPVHAGYARGVIAGRADDARNMGAVAVVIHRIWIAGRHKIHAVAIVYVAVTIIIHSIAVAIPGVLPRVDAQVGVRVIDARVDDADHNVFAADGKIPRP